MDNDGRYKDIQRLIREKMNVLQDFYICKKDDQEMHRKLEEAIQNNPNRDPREVLDYYCRPIIQSKVDSWN